MSGVAPARGQGFSLIEVLVALAIVAILGTQLYPSFVRHMVRVRRLEAQTALQQLMQQQERYHSQANTYATFSAGDTSPAGRQFKWWSGSSPSSSAYELEGQPCDGEPISQCVQLIAKPGTRLVISTFRDEDCQRLTLTSSGERRASGPGPGCWP